MSQDIKTVFNQLAREIFDADIKPHYFLPEKLRIMWHIFNRDQKLALNDFAEDYQYLVEQQAGENL